jgi:hypothetical protein
MATRAEILAEIERRKGPSRDNILAELERRGVQPQGNAFRAVAEPLAAIASGAIAEPIAGIAGLGAEALSALGADVPSGADVIGQVKESLTFQPPTQAGQAGLQAVGDVIAPIAEPLAQGVDFLADKTLDITGSPAAAAFVKTAPVAIAELFGLGALRKLRVGTKLIDDAGNPTKVLRKSLDKQGLDFENLTPEAKAQIPAIADQSFIAGRPLVPEASENALLEQIKSGGRDDALAGLKIVNNKVTPDKAGLEALKQGYAPGFVQSIKTSTPETKAQMQKMLNISRRIKKQERVGLDVRPGNIVGESVSKRIQFIRNKANDARKELDGIALKNLPGKEINSSTIIDQLQTSLNDLDIELVDGPKGVPTPEFKGSLISKDRGSQKAIRDVVDLLSEGGAPDALRAHKLKRQLDNIIDFNKKSVRGLGKEGRTVLMDIRKSLNNAVRDIDPDYARVNDTLSTSLTALDNFQDVAGTKMDIFGQGANSAIGQKMRGLMSNIQSRVPLENAVNGLDSTALSLGAKFGDDVKDLTMFANALDARFGNIAKTGFSGQIEQSINRVLTQGVSQEALQQGAKVAGKLAKKFSGVNEFNAFEAMTDLLNK